MNFSQPRFTSGLKSRFQTAKQRARSGLQTATQRAKSFRSRLPGTRRSFSLDKFTNFLRRGGKNYTKKKKVKKPKKN